MTREEALKKIAESKFTKEDLLKYMGVKDIDSLEFALEEKFKLNPNDGFINSSFEMVFNIRMKEQYNPLEEKYAFYAVIAEAFYGFNTDDLLILVKGIGLFMTIKLLEKLLENKDEVVYYNKMYQNYIIRKENIGLKLDKIINSIDNFIKGLNSIELEKLSQQLAQQIKEVDLNKVSK